MHTPAILLEQQYSKSDLALTSLAPDICPVDIGKKAIKRFGLRVAKCRKATRLTQMELALMLETDQVYISRVECGKVGPTLPVIARLAQSFDMTISELCEGV